MECRAVTVRSLRGVPEECNGCKKPLGTHRIVTVDKDGSPVRFNSDGCQCFMLWATHNVSGFVRRVEHAKV